MRVLVRVYGHSQGATAYGLREKYNMFNYYSCTAVRVAHAEGSALCIVVRRHIITAFYKGSVPDLHSSTVGHPESQILQANLWGTVHSPFGP